ncbi:hypothetical protein [Heliorestis acidaminivorans]|uniref:hypothetical protein n=1 Tax=Heliorestis acidaminivorans TaxID=553427 RepID=UPI001478F3C2|nr:hypothetical protein [Heliorestis acidaminivorans]
MPYRLQLILDRISKAQVSLSTLDAVVARGGLLKPLSRHQKSARSREKNRQG